jgi:GMP synthase-like glutamine amidotransferase
MKITLLEAGRAPGRLQELYPRYSDMFVSLLSGIDDTLTFKTVALVDGEAPPAPSTLDAVLITGSPAGVYDLTPWMAPLRAFVREASATKTPMVGVCFGHQIIADALGGEVRKSNKGWGVGRHTYDILDRESWMADAGSTLSLGVSHQDQVIVPPAGARTLARSAHTDHAMLVYDDAPILSLQGHPEFTDGFLTALYSARRGKTLSDDLVDQAIESLSTPEDNALTGDWMVRFLKGARG